MEILYQRAGDPGDESAWVSWWYSENVVRRWGLTPCVCCKIVAPAPIPSNALACRSGPLINVCWDELTLLWNFSEHQGKSWCWREGSPWGPREGTGVWGPSPQEWTCFGLLEVWVQRLVGTAGVSHGSSQPAFRDWIPPQAGRGTAWFPFSELAPHVMVPKCSRCLSHQDCAHPVLVCPQLPRTFMQLCRGQPEWLSKMFGVVSHVGIWCHIWTIILAVLRQ